MVAPTADLEIDQLVYTHRDAVSPLDAAAKMVRWRPSPRELTTIEQVDDLPSISHRGPLSMHAVPGVDGPAYVANFGDSCVVWSGSPLQPIGSKLWWPSGAAPEHAQFSPAAKNSDLLFCAVPGGVALRDVRHLDGFGALVGCQVGPSGRADWLIGCPLAPVALTLAAPGGLSVVWRLPLLAGFPPEVEPHQLQDTGPEARAARLGLVADPLHPPVDAAFLGSAEDLSLATVDALSNVWLYRVDLSEEGAGADPLTARVKLESTPQLGLPLTARSPHHRLMAAPAADVYYLARQDGWVLGLSARDGFVRHLGNVGVKMTGPCFIHPGGDMLLTGHRPPLAWPLAGGCLAAGPWVLGTFERPICEAVWGPGSYSVSLATTDGSIEFLDFDSPEANERLSPLTDPCTAALDHIQLGSAATRELGRELLALGRCGRAAGSPLRQAISGLRLAGATTEQLFQLREAGSTLLPRVASDGTRRPAFGPNFFDTFSGTFDILDASSSSQSSTDD